MVEFEKAKQRHRGGVECGPLSASIEILHNHFINGQKSSGEYFLFGIEICMDIMYLCALFISSPVQTNIMWSSKIHNECMLVS